MIGHLISLEELKHFVVQNFITMVEIKVRNNGYNRIQIFILRMLNKIVDTKIFGISIFPKYNSDWSCHFCQKGYILLREF